MNNEIRFNDTPETTEKKGIIAKLKIHKKEIILVSVTVASVVGAIIVSKNIDTTFERITSEVANLEESAGMIAKKIFDTPSITNTATNLSKPVTSSVTSHLRNLPKGQHASAQKISTAAEHGHSLGTNQTWVNNYTKNRVA